MKNGLQFVGVSVSSRFLWIAEFLSCLDVSGPYWLKDQEVVEFHLAGEILAEKLVDLRNILGGSGIDVFYVPLNGRRKNLLLADMDATIVTGETLDDLAAHIGIGADIAAITAQAMAGELDFEEALRARVSRLKGVSVAVLADVYAQMDLSVGARAVVQVMRTHGAQCVLVSGGFSYFTARVADLCGFHAHHGNILGLDGDVLSGDVVDPVLDKNAKLRYLESYARALGVSLSDCVTVGDGANDVPMLLAAGLGVGYHPKKLVREQVQNSIIHSDLTSLLYMQGYCWAEIAPYMKN